MAGWNAPRRTTPGGQAWYSDLAIELVLMLRLVFHLALRQAEGFAGSALRLLGQELRVPDHTTLSRRSRGFAGRRPKAVPHGPMHLVIDSTGLKLFGRGEWDAEKHGRARRSWRKLHLAVDADTGEIVACVLTDSGADDAGQVPALLGQIEGEIASVTADGAYDGEPVYQAVAGHQPDPPPDVVIPPRSSAVRARGLPAARRAGATAIFGSSRKKGAWPGSGRAATAGAASRRPRSGATRRSSVRDYAPAAWPPSRAKPPSPPRCSTA
jgi:IS5 family transposase